MSDVLFVPGLDHGPYEYYAQLYEVFKLLMVFQKQPPWPVNHKPGVWYDIMDFNYL